MAPTIRHDICSAPLFLGLILAAFAHSPTAVAANGPGVWSPVAPWPLIAIHAVLMPDGRILTYGTDADGRQTGYHIYDVWDPAAGLSGGHVTLPNVTGTDIFCSSQLVLPQGGGVFIAGGDVWNGQSTNNYGNNNTNLFNYDNNDLVHANDMNRDRWYSTSIALLNGEIYTQGGYGGEDFPEIRGTDGTFRLLSGADTSGFYFWYPRNFIAPDGRVFGYDSYANMYYINTGGNGSVAGMGSGGWEGEEDSSVAMFRPGRILQFGGPNSATAVVIDITGAAPTVTPTQPLSSARSWVTATILADGKVLATGGSEVRNELVNVNNIAEIWDPNTGQWTVGASGSLARLYHSTALLLPDASVLVAGGGAPGPLTNTNAEIYYPPYLYDGSGALASRPTIESAPSVLDIGQTFTVGFSGAPSISRVALVKAGSVTHSFNMEQRFIELSFTANGGQLTVQMTPRVADATPGYYLLFILDSAGTPSIARIVRVNVATTAVDADGDGIADSADNCINVANGPLSPDAGGASQLDGDHDGYGNICDGDFGNPAPGNGATNAQDYAIFRTKLSTADTVADLNHSGIVNTQDYAIFRSLLGSPPGPSGLACAGTVPCPSP